LSPPSNIMTLYSSYHLTQFFYIQTFFELVIKKKKSMCQNTVFPQKSLFLIHILTVSCWQIRSVLYFKINNNLQLLRAVKMNVRFKNRCLRFCMCVLIYGWPCIYRDVLYMSPIYGALVPHKFGQMPHKSYQLFHTLGSYNGINPIVYIYNIECIVMLIR
jgi:hypothetical protein